MVTKPRGFHLKCPDIVMNNNKLVFVEKTKYLWVVFCNDLEEDEHMLRHLLSFYARPNSIIRKCHNCSIGVKLHLFYAYCCTIYCSQLWILFNKSTYLKLKVAYNNMHSGRDKSKERQEQRSWKWGRQDGRGQDRM